MFVICGMVFIFSAWKLYRYHVSYQEAENIYTKIREQAEIKKKNEERTIDFTRLKKMNSDVVGWIYIPGTNIDYPIVQGKDNEEYLHKTFDGKKNSSGTIFMDQKGKKDFTADNNVIYGHHMKNGTMFADLLKFRQESFVKKNRYIFLYTLNQRKKLQVVSAYAGEAKGEIPISFANRKDQQAYLKKVCSKSQVSIAMKKNQEETVKRIYTFVTCSYEKEDYRTFVYAVETSDE